MERKCNMCQQVKAITSFNRQKKKNGSQGHQFTCRHCNSAYQKEWRKKNNPSVQQKKRNKRGETIKWIRDSKTDKPCVDCKQIFFHYVMDYDHVGPKTFSISHSPSKGYNLESIKKEIEKCELVCANCHRVRTWNRQGHPPDPKYRPLPP